MSTTATKPQDRAALSPTAYQIALARNFVKHLGTGRGKAKTAAQLAAEMHTTPRAVQKCAETARRIGFPVIAHSVGNPKGYFIAESALDVTDYAGRLYRRFGEIAKTRRELLKNLEKWDFETQQYNDAEEV